MPENKMLNSFKEDLNLKTTKSLTNYFETNLFIKLTTFGVVVTSLFWIVYNMVSSKKTLETIGFTTVIVQFVLALSVLLMSFTTFSKSRKLMDIVTFVYDCLLVISTTFLVVEKNMQLSEAVGNSEIRSGIPLVAFYYLLVTVTPLPKLKHGIPIFILLILSAFVPMWFSGSEVYSVIDNLILRIYTVALYYVFHRTNESVIKEKRISSRLNDELFDASLQDLLTGTLNKRALYKYTNKISFDANVKSIGTIIFDIDNFKSYNDTYGHKKGDDALEQVCKIAMNILLEYGFYLFRYGGEEFVFYMKDPSYERLVELSTNIRKAVYNANIEREDNESGRITITVGASIQETIKEENIDYVSKADQQLYIGKERGKNCLVIENKTYR